MGGGRDLPVFLRNVLDINISQVICSDFVAISLSGLDGGVYNPM